MNKLFNIKLKENKCLQNTAHLPDTKKTNLQIMEVKKNKNEGKISILKRQSQDLDLIAKMGLKAKKGNLSKILKELMALGMFFYPCR